MKQVHRTPRTRVLGILFVAILMLIGAGILSINIARVVEARSWSVKGATWNNITVGKSTISQVIQELGEPDRKEPLLNIFSSRTFYYHVDEHGHADYVISFTGGVVSYIRDDPIGSMDRTLSGFIEQYGKPDHIAWSLWASHSGRIVIFVDNGILLRVLSEYPTPEQAWVDGAEYFIPCSLECVLGHYSYLITDGPSQVDPRPARDPWGLTNEEE